MRIYKIKNNINGKVYIGQTTSPGKVRWLNHVNKLRKNIHPNKHLQSAWNKYGEKSFTYKIITNSCVGLLDVLEKKYINKYKSTDNKYGYNKDGGGHLSRKRAPISQETRRKLSIARIGKKRGPHSRATKNKISLANKGKPAYNKGVSSNKKGIPSGISPSVETRLKMSEKAKAFWVKKKSREGCLDV
jgi:group I intron endonuclease